MDPTSGTKVKLKNKTGGVVDTRRDGEGYLEYKVVFDSKGRKNSGAKEFIDTCQLLKVPNVPGVPRSSGGRTRSDGWEKSYAVFYI